MESEGIFFYRDAGIAESNSLASPGVSLQW